VTVIRSGL